eukprot:3287693-Rhodomonas_salina.1
MHRHKVLSAAQETWTFEHPNHQVPRCPMSCSSSLVFLLFWGRFRPRMRVCVFASAAVRSWRGVVGSEERERDARGGWASEKQLGADLQGEEADACVCWGLISQVPIDNTRQSTHRFQVARSSCLHGFAGYFDALLYGDVHISIYPETFSTGMFSWFPLFFPIRNPMSAPPGPHLARSACLALRWSLLVACWVGQ